MSVLFDTPYEIYYGSTGAKWQRTIHGAAYLFGWNYHNEGDSTIYLKYYDTDDDFFDPAALTPKVRVGMPPEQSSGNILCEGGIDGPFTLGIGIAIMSSIADGTNDDFAWDVSQTTFYSLIADL